VGLLLIIAELIFQYADTNFVDVKTSSNAFALIVYKCFVFLRFLRETFIDMAFLICQIGRSTNAMVNQLAISIKVFVKNNDKG
jgi:hypothetical protein